MRDTVTAFNNINTHFIKVSTLLAEHRHSTQNKSIVSFWGKGKTGVPGENLSEQRREPTKSTHL